MFPILYQNHDLILYSYPLMMGLGWGVAYQIYFSLVASTTSQKHAHILFWGIFVSAWIGSKILFTLTLPSLESSDILASLSFWTGGGFVFYGGFLGGVLFLSLYHAFGFKLTLEKFWPILPALIFGHGIGRLGCMMAGCCFGKPTDWVWGVLLHEHYRHPTQLIEAFSLMTFGFYLLKSHKPRMILFSFYLGFYGVLRFVIEQLRADEVRGQWGSLTPSQWISILLISSGVFIYLRSKKSAT